MISTIQGQKTFRRLCLVKEIKCLPKTVSFHYSFHFVYLFVVLSIFPSNYLYQVFKWTIIRTLTYTELVTVFHCSSDLHFCSYQTSIQIICDMIILKNSEENYVISNRSNIIRTNGSCCSSNIVVIL